MKKHLRYLIVVTVILLLLFCVMSIVFFRYYANRFPINTWINGVYCTGKTVYEVNSELQQKYEASVVCITDANRASWELEMDEALVTPHFEDTLQKILRENTGVEQGETKQESIDIQSLIISDMKKSNWKIGFGLWNLW